MTERRIVEKIFESRRIVEASFESGGDTYTSAFGRYTRNGEEITRNEYFTAKEDATSAKDDNDKSKDKSDDSQDLDITSMSKTAGSTVKKGKEGPYYYDNGDISAFDKSVEDMTTAFKERYKDAKTVQTSKSQTVTYDEESGYAIVTKKSDKSGNSWTQYKKLNDKDRDTIKKSLENTGKNSSDEEDEELLQRINNGDTDAQDLLVSKYEKLAHYLAKDLFVAGGDQEDLAQEGLLGLVSAMRDYKPGMNKNFKQFAILSMKRNMQDAIRSANRKKNSPLNQADNYETSLEMEPTGNSAEDDYMEKDDKSRLDNYIKKNLTPWEQEVLGYYLNGYGYDEIASKTKKNNKSINNAMNMVRSKLRKYKETYKESKSVVRVLEALESDSKDLLLEAYKYLYE